ncbi:sulfated surface glycoprotein 185-like [Glycine soja]|uniref:sulfated surface glycoprotein 185-like n=1 Tax=Glycine soja TaxID=3848 RepID=UPI00104099BE|nr:sulfated surface glycoprotein 185-like [Glycine soja]
MVESTRSTVTSDQLEDALTKLTTHKIYLTHTIQQLMHKIDALIHHLPQPAPPSHFPSSSAITASHGYLSLYSDHARPQHPPVHLFPPPSSSTTTPSSSFAKALLAHTPMPTPPLMLTPPLIPTPTPPPTPPPPPLPALRQQHPTPVSAPPTIVVIPLLVNSKPHAPSDCR